LILEAEVWNSNWEFNRLTAEFPLHTVNHVSPRNKDKKVLFKVLVQEKSISMVKILI